MFLSGWMRRRQRRRALRTAERIINEYGTVVERYAGFAIVPASLLPRPKEQVKAAFRLLCQFSDEAHREILGSGYVLLANFSEEAPRPLGSLEAGDLLALSVLEGRQLLEEFRCLPEATDN